MQIQGTEFWLNIFSAENHADACTQEASHNGF